MLFVSTVEDRANPVSELVSTEQPLGLDYLAFAMNPLRLDGIEPRTLGGQQRWHYPDPSAAGFDTAVVGADPAPHLSAFVPRGVVPNKKQDLVAPPLEPVAAPPKKACGYGTHRAAVHEPQPGLFELRQVKPVTGESLRLRIILSRPFLKEAHRLRSLRPGMQRRSLEARKPALVLETHSPPWMALGEADQSVSSPFFRAYPGSALSIQRLARSQRNPSRESVARMVSPLTRSLVSPSSKLTSAASLSVQRLLFLPNSLGERCISSRRERALSSSKAAWTSLGREEFALRASSPRPLKSWMASRTVCCPQPRFLAICGARSPRALDKSIWQRRSTKAFEERRLSSSASRSSSESVRMKMGGLMFVTITHNPKPVLEVHYVLVGAGIALLYDLSVDLCG